jgi:peptidoglycan/xylan/chitin deacetylase (PgdA/CDA1 family)
MPERDDVLILAYHAVSDTWPAALAVSEADLRRQLRSLVDDGYRGATLSEALASGAGEKLLVTSFDDAYGSVLERALPVLQELGLPGTVFAPTDWPGRTPMTWPGIEQWVGGPHEAEMRCLSWDELSRLVDLGWEVGSHTCSHPHLTMLGDEALRRELLDSRLVCEERLGRPCPTIAYPYGDHDDRVIAAAGEAGYRWACALPDRTLPVHDLRLSRVGVYRDESWLRFRAKVSPLVRRVRATGMVEPLVRRLRRA